MIVNTAETRFSTCLLVILVLMLPFPAFAKESITLKNGALVTLEKGRIALWVGTMETWSFTLTEAGSDTGTSLKKYDLAEALEAVHARVTVSGGRTEEALFIPKKQKKSLDVVWQSTTTLAGDPGERIGPALRFSDLTGDGLPEVVLGQVSETVRLCGKKELPLLFRKVYDPKKKRFRPVLARRPALLEPKDLDGTPDPGKGPTQSLIQQVLPTAVSRMAGDRGEPILLSLPTVLLDGDPATPWTPIPGNGAGEFASFDILANAYGVTRIGIRPLPKAKRLKRYDRPRTLLLATETSVLRLHFPEDPLDQPDKVIWFDLPVPVKTSCLSLIVETTYAQSPKRFLALAEMIVLTEADTAEGLMRLAKDLKNPNKRRQAAMLLERAGTDSMEPIRTVWPSLDLQGRRRALNVLSNVGPAESSDLLVEAVLDRDPETHQIAQRGLKAAGNAAVVPLSNVLKSPDNDRFTAAADLLASLDSPDALKALITVSGKGNRKRRAFLRSRIAMATGRDPKRADLLWAQIDNADQHKNKEMLFDLIRAGLGTPGLAKPISELTNRLYERSSSFDDRYRLLDVMGQLGCHLEGDHLVDAARDPDHLIRMVAVSGLGACIVASKGIAPVLHHALLDKAPEVRLAALQTIKKVRLAGTALDKLTDLAGSDPWPEVRALVVSNTTQLSPEQALPLLEQAHRDSSIRVRTATLKSAASFPGDKTDQIIEAHLLNENELPELRLKAAHIAGTRCQKSFLPALFEVLQKGAEPLADYKDISAALTAAKAMGAIGGPEAETLLKKARQRSNPATDKAIDAALATLGEQCK